MPRCSKRSRSAAPPGDLVPGATALDDHHHHKRSRNTSSRRHSKAEDSSFSVKKCIAWFKEYTTATEPDVLGPEGMEKFCEDLGVEPENVVMLVIAYKMAAKQMGFFTQEEWLKGLTELQCDTVHKLQSKLDHLRNTLNDPYIFKAIYRYSYDFARDKEQRSLETGTARALLGVLLPRWPLRAPLAAFLQQEPRYRVLNRDQWCNILEFSRTVGLDLAAYDPDGACRYSSASASAAPPARARLTSASFCRRARAARRVRGVAAGRARRRRAPRRPAHRTHLAPRQLRPPPARRPP